MKAKLKATGETVEVNSSGTMRISCGAYHTSDGRILPATALEFDKVIDWEQRRYEVAKAAIQGFCANSDPVMTKDITFARFAEWGVKLADALIEELKKFPQIKEVRGRGLMIGMEFIEPIKEIRQQLLFEQKVFTGVSGTNVIRLLPPLCLSMAEADEFLSRLHAVLK